MKYEKEREFIVAYDDDGNMKGKWDILHNVFIGVKGQPIKTVPRAFCYTANAPAYIVCARDFVNRYSRYYTYYGTITSNVEAIVSVKLVPPLHDSETWEYMRNNLLRLPKGLVDYIRENQNGVFSLRALTEYNLNVQYQDLIARFTDETERNWVQSVIYSVNGSRTPIPADFIKGMLIRAVHEKIHVIYSGYSFGRMLIDWVNDVRCMGEKLEMKHNILTNHAILRYLAQEYKKTHYDEGIQRFNNIPALYFETEEYIIRPLLSKEDFHTEANVQRNCVENMYMERVFNGSTHVVCVRKKTAPDVPYITCEVDNDGIIRQYVLRFNQRPSETKDKELKEMYEVHLREAWGKGE